MRGKRRSCAATPSWKHDFQAVSSTDPRLLFNLSARDPFPRVGATGGTGSCGSLSRKKLADFNGNYTGVSAGATVAGGGGGMALQNQNRVVLNLVGTTQGLKFKLGVDGVKLTLKQ
jgi:hypothetical protein